MEDGMNITSHDGASAITQSMSPKSKIVLYAELLSNIRQISVIAELSSPATSTTTAKLLHDGFVLEVYHEGVSRSLKLPAQVSSSNQVAQLQVGKQEISWRFPLAQSPPTRPGAEFVDTAVAPWPASKLSSESSFCCRKCSSSIIARGVVNIWKDLPSENWAEMMDFWHCHKPDVKHVPTDGQEKSLVDVKGYGANNRFVAGQGVGFVNLTYFLLNPEDCTNVITTDNGILQCSDCHAYLGEYDTLRSSNRIQKWALSMTSPSSTPTSPPLAQFVTAQLLSQLSSQAISKFLLHSSSITPGSIPTPMIHTWLFSPHLTISLTDATGSASTTAVIKIFYRTISSEEKEKLTGDTKILSAVEEVELEEGVLVELQRLLRASTARLPESMRVFGGGWNVGFLERFVAGDDAS